MKRRWLMHIIRTGVVAGLGIIMLTGCKEENKVDYSIKGVSEEEQASSDAGKTGVAQFRDVDTWKESWGALNEEGEYSIYEVDMNAKIVVPNVEHMSVIEVEEPEFNAEYKEKLAKGLFENEGIYNGDKPTKKDIAEQEAFMDASGGSVVYYPRVSGIILDDWFLYAEVPVDAVSVETSGDAVSEEAPDSYAPVDGYTGYRYVGTYEGKLYKLNFIETEEFIHYKKEIRFEVKDLREVCPEEFQKIEWPACVPWTEGDVPENHAQLSEEEALKQAQRFVEKLGMEYPVLAYSCPLVWGDATGALSDEAIANWTANGYVFTFDFGVDDISFVEYGIETDYYNYGLYWKKADVNSRYSMESRMQVYVTDKGVIRMSAYNPLETVSVSEQVEMLPFDTIKNIVREQLETHYKDCHFFPLHPSVYFDRMDLIYFRMEDEENPGRYSYVPTWRLSEFTESKIKHYVSVTNPVLFNAIDGSFVKMWWDLQSEDS